MPRWDGYVRATLTCPVCHKDFIVHPCELNKRKYCSPKCFLSTLKGKPSPLKGRTYKEPKPPRTKICQVCGEEFTPPHRNRQYCDNCRLAALAGSERLRQIRYRIKNAGRINAQSRGRDPQYKANYDDEMRFNGNRKEVLARDNNQCQFPGCTKIKPLIVHHKNMDKIDNRPENLITLCRRHHMQLHGLIEPLRHLIFSNGQ